MRHVVRAAIDINNDVKMFAQGLFENTYCQTQMPRPPPPPKYHPSGASTLLACYQYLKKGIFSMKCFDVSNIFTYF